MLDVSRSSEDALQIDPAPLHINPDVKQSIDAVQLVFPSKRLFLKLLVVRRELHGSHAVNVLLDLVKKVIPSSDQAALVLVVDQIQLIGLPHFADLWSRVLMSGDRRYPNKQTCLRNSSSAISP